jgi:hypothetical protein
LESSPSNTVPVLIRAEIQASASERNRAAFEERTRLHRDLEAKVDLLYPSCVQRFLINNYERAAAANRWAAYVSGLLFALGTLIMLFLLLLKTLQVLRA